ncbi:MAG: YDG domain-containing protein, partial [Acidiferrobacteraceae bacterium]
MNRIYRLVWQRSIGCWVAVSELAKGSRPGTPGSSLAGRPRLRTPFTLALSLLTSALVFAGSITSAYASPVGGQITAGAGQISQSGNTTTIVQNSGHLTLNWQSFNIAPQQTVNFIQPGATSLAVNHILGSQGSVILGHLNANGQVWLINPNGVLFGRSAQVDVGGLVASTLSPAGNGTTETFSGNGAGAVINDGTIHAAPGGYVSLIGNQVSNEGVITATLGTVALAGGNQVSVQFSGSHLIHIVVDKSTLNALAANGQLISANGGRVIMTAGAKESLLASAVNNTGVVQAQTLENHDGVITLLAGMQAGQTDVGGILDASAPDGGRGGSINTSAAHVSITAGADVSAYSKFGQSGNWLIDPTDLTIDALAATTIDAALNAGTSVTEQTTATGASGSGLQSSGPGDINVDSALTWTNAAATLTLSAYDGINVNAPISGTGSVVMDAANGNLTIASGASVTGGAGVTLATGANFVNNAGSGAVSSSARWLVYSTNPALDTTGGLTPQFVQYNSSYPASPDPSTGNGFLYSEAPSLTVTGLTGNVAKTYDGTTTALLSGSNVTVSGLVNGDSLVSLTGAYGSANAGANLLVTSSSSATGLTVDTSTGLPVYGYTISSAPVSGNIGTINPALLTASIVGTPTKVYDGTTTATLTSANYSIAGFVLGQSATVNQPSTVSYSAANAGAQTVSATFSNTSFVAGSSTNLLNYTLPTAATGAGDIQQAPVDITGVLANNKIYDGTTADTLNTTSAGLYGVISSDTSSVTLSAAGATGHFLAANVGNNLAVSANGFTLSGASASNYQLIQPAGLTASITPKSLTITGVAATNKVYDGTTADSLSTGSAALSGVISSDASNVVLTATNATGTFSTANVGNALTVTAGGFAISGSAASNYVLGQPSGLAADITPRPLAIAIIGNPSKSYNGTTTAIVPSGDFSVSGFISGQGAAIPQNALAEYSSSNAGNVSVTATLAVSDFLPNTGTSLSNYSLPSSVTGAGTITAAALSASIINNPTKVYDGTTAGTLNSSNYSVSGFVAGQGVTVNQTIGAYASPNAGVETITASVGASNYVAGSGTLLSNYILPTSISGSGTITPAVISGDIQASIINDPTKAYDGTTAATLTSSDYSLSGFVSGQGATVNQPVGQYASPNAGAESVTATLTSPDFVANAGTNLANYTLPTAAYGTGTITPVSLTVAIVNNPTKVYDGTTTAVLPFSDYQISGFVGSQGAQINPSALINYASANVGARSLTATLTPSAYTANTGTLMSNYVLPTSATGMGTVTPASVYVTGVSATNKVYDTTTADSLSLGNAALSGVITADTGNVALVDSSASGTFSTATVGSNIPVTPSGFSISGTAASNYALQPVTGLTADITPASLQVTNVIANNKPYDGSNSATLNTTSATLTGVLSNDAVTLSSSGANGTFGSVNVGNGLAVTTAGFGISGAQAQDYVLNQPGGLTADITPAVITATITGNPTKVYDATTSTTLTAGDYTLSGFAAGQGASLPQSASANYASANVGAGVGVTSTLVVSDFVANSGTNLSNYALPATGAGTGTITAAPITAVIIGDPTKAYNGTTLATLTGSEFQLAGFVGPQDATVNQTVGTYVSPNAGPESVSASLAAGNFTGVSGTILSNYSLPASATGNGDITPAPLSVINVQTTNRTYNGTTLDALTGATLTGTTY